MNVVKLKVRLVLAKVICGLYEVKPIYFLGNLPGKYFNTGFFLNTLLFYILGLQMPGFCQHFLTIAEICTSVHISAGLQLAFLFSFHPCLWLQMTCM